MKRLLATGIKIVIFFAGWAICAGLIDVPAEDPAIWRLFAELIPLAFTIIFTVTFWLIEKQNIHIPVANHGFVGVGIGTVLGILWIGAAFGIVYGFGGIKFIGKNDVSAIAIWIIAAILNVIMQEILIRGYIYQLIKKQWNTFAAVIVSTALFTFLHGGAFSAGIIPVINVISMSLFMSALYEVAGTLLAPIMSHAIWNVIGSIILGCVSLADDYPHLYDTIACGARWLSGGEYKIEGSVVVLVLNIVLALVCLYGVRKNRRGPCDDDR